MKYTEQQKVAYHEAAHVVAYLRHDVGFHAVHLAQDDGTITLSNGTVKTDAAGTVEIEDPYELYNWSGEENANDYLILVLAGICASKIMSPHRTYIWLVNSGTAFTDWLHARAFAKSDLLACTLRDAVNEGKTAVELNETPEDVADLYILSSLPAARRFVKREWSAVVRIGDALLASPTKSLTQAQCQQLITSMEQSTTKN